MAFVRIWVHTVQRTKNSSKVLSIDKRERLFAHIRENAVKKQIFIDTINGHLDHVHCLLGLNADMSISKTMQLIKGEAAFWANNEKLVLPKLEWGDEYFASSVSESMLDKVRAYINNQEEHHKKVSFQQEYDLFMQKYGYNSHG